MVFVRQGYCNNGKYAGGDASIATEEACNVECLAEDFCVYAALKPGVTCDRFSSTADEETSCEEGGTDDYTLYKKTPCPCSAIPAATCAGSAEPCYFDASCNDETSPFYYGGLGCNAGGVDQSCRFCGFGEYNACPEIPIRTTSHRLDYSVKDLFLNMSLKTNATRSPFQ